MSRRSVYDLETVTLPRLSGPLMKLITNMLETPLTRPLVIGTFLTNSGVVKFRQTPADDPPTYLPVLPHPGDNPHTPPDLRTVPGRERPSDGFRFRTARDYAQAYRDGSLTPLEVAERALEAIDASETLDPAMRVFIAIDREDVMRQAREATARIKAGTPLSVFDGVPVAVKDEVDMTPYPTTAGTSFLGKEPAASDSTVVARMRAAGALLLGKANMHEIGITTTNLNIHHGTPRNPYDPTRYTGGSSGGSAAAAAIGFCPVAIGADGGGSIRIPAAFCGMVGLKPTWGRVSEYGAAPIDWSVAHLGPIAATVEDCALAYAILAGPDPGDPFSLNQPPVTIDGWDNDDLSGLTLGVFPDWFNHAAPDIVAACQRMVENLKTRGAAIKEVALPDLDAIRVAHTITILSEMATGMEPYYAQHRRDFDYNTRILLAIGREMTSRDFVHAQRFRTRAMRHVEAIFQEVDAILTPTTAITAPPIPPGVLVGGESDTTTVVATMRFIFLTNLTGHPSITVPVGYDQAGLPIGMQVIGRGWQEHTLLRVAFAAEGFLTRRQPEAHYDLLGA